MQKETQRETFEQVFFLHEFKMYFILKLIFFTSYVILNFCPWSVTFFFLLVFIN